MHDSLRSEIFKTLLFLGVAWVLGWLSGHEAVFVGGALSVLLASHLYFASKLLQWSDNPKRFDLPEGRGIWKYIYRSAYARYKQNRRRKKRLAGMLGEFRASTTALPDAAVVLDFQGRINWLNGAASELLGLLSKRDIGQRIGNLLRHPDFVHYFESGSWSEMGGGIGEGIEIPSPVDETAILWVRVIAYGNQQKLLIARDVSAFKRLEMTRRDFVANASHELRTPLTVVKGYLDMMGEETDEGEHLAQWHAPIEEMRKQATRMQQIIADLLKLANLETITGKARRDEVEMPALLAGLIEEAEILSSGRHTLERQIDNDLILLGDSSQLHSIVANLLSNAVRYSLAGGRIRLEWGMQGAQAVLKVQDFGIGISARDLPRLTERFYRSDAARSRETGGTGLGLAIVKHAVEQHEAELTISSEVGHGSCFICHFPATRSVRKDAGLIH